MKNNTSPHHGGNIAEQSQSQYPPATEEPEEEYAEPLPGPEARADIASRLRALSLDMSILASDMAYHGGFGPMGIKSTEMLAAAQIAREWADAVEAMA